MTLGKERGRTFSLGRARMPAAFGSSSSDGWRCRCDLSSSRCWISSLSLRGRMYGWTAGAVETGDPIGAGFGTRQVGKLLESGVCARACCGFFFCLVPLKGTSSSFRLELV